MIADRFEVEKADYTGTYIYILSTVGRSFKRAERVSEAATVLVVRITFVLYMLRRPDGTDMRTTETTV